MYFGILTVFGIFGDVLAGNLAVNLAGKIK